MRERSAALSDLTYDGPSDRFASRVSTYHLSSALLLEAHVPGARLVPLPGELAATLRALRRRMDPDDALVFPGREGAPADAGSLRRRVLVPAAQRAGLSGVGFHTLRHTCASLLIERGLSVLRLQRWMGHHSPAFTLETYGHLIDGDLGPALDLREELATGRI